MNLGRLVITVVVLYSAMIALLYANQTEIIFPGAYRPPAGATVPDGQDGVRVLTQTSAQDGRITFLSGAALNVDGTPIRHPDKRPTLLFFYGNGERAADELWRMDCLRKEGLNVYIPDYPGFGMSGGSPSETGCYAAADTVYGYATRTAHVDPSRIVIAGWSLGAAVAIDLAVRKHPAGLVILSAFTSMADMGSHKYPIVPVPLLRLIVKHPFTNDAKIRHIHCPIFIAHSRQDQFIPYSMSTRLESAAGGPVTRFVVLTGDHGTIFDVGGRPLYDAIGRFVDNSVAAHAASKRSSKD